MVRDDKGALFHTEEQRNLRKADMYRFAAYHFMAAEQWGDELTDIILASGDVYAGEKSIVTKSGKYTPVVTDFFSLQKSAAQSGKGNLKTGWSLCSCRSTGRRQDPGAVRWWKISCALKAGCIMQAKCLPSYWPLP